MHGLDTIVAMNRRAVEAHDQAEANAFQWYDVREHFVSNNPDVPATLVSEFRFGTHAEAINMRALLQVSRKNQGYTLLAENGGKWGWSHTITVSVD